MPSTESPAPASFYEGATYTPEDSVGHLMRRVMQGMIDEIGERLGPIGLTHAQWSPLLLLHTGRASTVAELAREHLTDPGATTRLLDRLEAKGLCRRVRSLQDRRVVTVELTPEGRDVAARIPAVLSEVMNARLAGFTRDEWADLRQMLERMILNGESMRA
jgi:DNA-binding MarR family transcriptional regulator